MKIEMKKMILTLVAAFALSATMMAQEARDGAGQGRRFDKSEMLQRRTDRVVKRYGLNEEQAKQLLKLNTAYADKLPNFGFRQRGPRRQMGQGGQQATNGQAGTATQQQNQRPSKEQMEAWRKERQANMESYNKELQKIMTPDQFTQYTNDMKNFRQRGPRGPRGGQGQPTA